MLEIPLAGLRLVTGLDLVDAICLGGKYRLQEPSVWWSWDGVRLQAMGYEKS